MTEQNYLTSLKNKEFLILQRLCDNSLSENDKIKLEKELNQTRSEIERLG